MGITFGLPSGERTRVEADAVLIGTDAACQVRLPSDGNVQPRHARVRKTAGRWLVESLGDWLLQVGGGSPGRLGWLRPGDVIRLSEAGPNLTFEPTASVTPASGPSLGGPDELAIGLEPEPDSSVPPVATVPTPTRPGPPPLPKPGPPLPVKKGPPPLPVKKRPPPLPGKNNGPPPLPK